MTADTGTHIPNHLLDLTRKIENLVPSQAEGLLTRMYDGLNSTDEATRYQAAEALTSAIYPKYKFSEFARIFLEDQEFLHYYQRFMDEENWHSLDRKYTLNQLLKLCANLQGDLAECGVYKGASAYLMCRANRQTGRIIHLFDSFSGLSEPDHRDGEYWFKGALSAGEDTLSNSLAGFENFRIYSGWIPGRFHEVSNLQFCFLHIDVDLYEPTLASLVFFYERIVSGGLILMDDYGFKTCPGAKQAADEFFSDKSEQIILLPTGQAFVVKQQ